MHWLCWPRHDSPDRPPSILVQKVNAGFSLAKVLSGTLDLELHEALPPVIYLACAGGKHADGNLQDKYSTVLQPYHARTTRPCVSCTSACDNVAEHISIVKC